MKKYFEMDKKDNNFGYVSVEGNDSKVTLLVEKIENVWVLNSFIYGRVGNISDMYEYLNYIYLYKSVTDIKLYIGGELIDYIDYLG